VPDFVEIFSPSKEMSRHGRPGGQSTRKHNSFAVCYSGTDK